MAATTGHSSVAVTTGLKIVPKLISTAGAALELADGDNDPLGLTDGLTLGLTDGLTLALGD